MREEKKKDANNPTTKRKGQPQTPAFWFLKLLRHQILQIALSFDAFRFFLRV